MPQAPRIRGRLLRLEPLECGFAQGGGGLNDILRHTHPQEAFHSFLLFFHLVSRWFDITAAQGMEDAEALKLRAFISMTREETPRVQALARRYWQAYVLPFQ